MENYSNIENIIDTAQRNLSIGNKQKVWRYSPIVYTKPDDHKLWVKFGNANVVNKVQSDVAKFVMILP